MQMNFHCREVAAGPRGSGRAAFLEAVDGRLRGCVHGNGVLEAIEDFVGGVLDTSVGFVQLAGCLGGKLTEFVAIGDVSECSKN